MQIIPSLNKVTLNHRWEYTIMGLNSGFDIVINKRLHCQGYHSNHNPKRRRCSCYTKANLKRQPCPNDLCQSDLALNSSYCWEYTTIGLDSAFGKKYLPKSSGEDRKQSSAANPRCRSQLMGPPQLGGTLPGAVEQSPCRWITFDTCAI